MANNRTHIVTVSSGKGGVGKTTTVACLADAWSASGLKVGVINTDPNKTLTRWILDGQKKGFFANVEFAEVLEDKHLIGGVKEMVQKVDILLIDVAGGLSTTLLKAAGFAHLVIIPTTPNKDDIVEAVKTRDVVKEAMELTSKTIPYKTLLTQAKRNTNVYDHMVQQLNKIKFPMFATIMHYATVYRTARFHDATPLSWGDYTEARTQIKDLAKEVLSFLENGTIAPPAETERESA